ncbi:hypothetical protein GIB67_028350 [Kingdonia uniflora]|uniref:Plastocyanin-like domain-containing protein n=1 Tax=Kingdonia uniflora TaxID=39325 RepID=A0A7J7MI97_9MAGN|nr:hypothetical protein GIB67_028350 [Kingdonia uniflora]
MDHNGQGYVDVTELCLVVVMPMDWIQVGVKTERAYNPRFSAHKRGSWGSTEQNEIDFAASPMVVKPIPLDFDAMSTPSKEKPSSSSTRNGGNLPVTPMARTNAVIRSSVNGGGFLSKMVDFNKGESNVRKSCSVPFSPMPKFPRSKSVTEREQGIPRSPLQTALGKEEIDSPSQAKKHKSGSLQQSRSGCAKFSEKAAGGECSTTVAVNRGHSYTMRIMECKEKVDYTVLYESQFLMELQSHSCLTTTEASYLTISTIKPPLNKQQNFLQYSFNGLESLRIARLTYLSELNFEIEGYNMTVVEADRHYVEPFVELKISGYLSSSPPSATFFAFSPLILSISDYPTVGNIELNISGYMSSSPP